jgi:DNA-binding response OmpR family regulator
LIADPEPKKVATKRILMIEDDPGSRQVVEMALQGEAYQLIEAVSGDEGLAKAHSERPDLILLDIHMPGMSGLDVCRRLRADGSLVPIIMLTARTDTIDKVVGLEVGADDYVTKPFEVRELLARIGAHLRRREATRETAPRSPQIEFPGLSLDTDARRAWRDEKEISLTVTEFNLLALLASHPGKAFSRADLLRDIWGYEVDIETRTVDAHVYRLRKKIEADTERPRYIHSVPGVGYRFSSE